MLPPVESCLPVLPFKKKLHLKKKDITRASRLIHLSHANEGFYWTRDAELGIGRRPGRHARPFREWVRPTREKVSMGIDSTTLRASQPHPSVVVGLIAHSELSHDRRKEIPDSPSQEEHVSLSPILHTASMSRKILSLTLHDATTDQEVVHTWDKRLTQLRDSRSAETLHLCDR